MNSINQSQPGENKQDINGQEAVAKIKELAGKAKTCFFCTSIQTGKPFATRPMAVQEVDSQGNIWFLSADDSFKNEEIINIDPYVQLLFQGSHYSNFMWLYGKASVMRDKEKINDLWEPMIKNWFTEGKDDPRITIIKVELQDGYYWDTKHGSLVAFAKRIAGTVTGQTLDDSVEGRLKV